MQTHGILGFYNLKNRLATFSFHGYSVGTARLRDDGQWHPNETLAPIIGSAPRPHPDDIIDALRAVTSNLLYDTAKEAIRLLRNYRR